MHLEKGIATRDDIDTTLKLGMAHPMGPLQLGMLSMNLCIPIYPDSTFLADLWVVLSFLYDVVLKGPLF